jgi:hypothetical protein
MKMLDATQLIEVLDKLVLMVYFEIGTLGVTHLLKVIEPLAAK